MDQDQAQYQSTVDRWKEAVKNYGRGWNEDGPEIGVDHWLDVDMVKYRLAGLFRYFDGKEPYLFTTPSCDIMVRVKKVKAHMNRMISAVEFAAEELRAQAGAHGTAVAIWDFLKLAVDKLDAAHHGSAFRVTANTVLTQRLKGHCTGIPSTLPWNAGFTYARYHPCAESNELDKGRPATSCPACQGAKITEKYTLMLETTVFTVCPFVLYETDGHQSHTQRTHVKVELDADQPLNGAAVMREITTRLVPVMSNMKIPDEVVQVLKSYSGPTFTEDGAVRVQKILRGVGAEMCPDGEISQLRVRVISEDSHLAHDIVTTLNTPFE